MGAPFFFMNKIAALYVAENGPYFGLENVEPWDLKRDAKLYQGPYPVVAHPPCERWGKYWYGGPSVKDRKVLGDDNGCFAAALASVREFGGVLEHPAYTHAWRAFNLKRPPTTGGWVVADEYGYTCHIEQGNYGHPARKATWLYAVGTPRPDLIWGPSVNRMRIEDGFHSTEERRVARLNGIKPVERLSKRERIHTPIEFRDLLIDLVLETYDNR